MKLNAPEWVFIFGGIIGAAAQGCLIPLYAIFFGDVLGVSDVSEVHYRKKNTNTNLPVLKMILRKLLLGTRVLFNTSFFSGSVKVIFHHE